MGEMGMIVVAGDVMIDMTLIGVPSRISPEQAHSLVHVMDDVPDIALGGAGNVAKVLADQNLPTELIGKIGNDAYGVMLLDQCHKLGIQTRNLSVDSGPTTLKVRAISQDGTHYVMKGRWDLDRKPYTENGPISPVVGWSDVSGLIFSDYRKGVFPKGFDIGAPDHVTSFLDPKPETIASLRKEVVVDYILPNNKEWDFLLKDYGSFDPDNRRYGNLLIRSGIIVTMGAEGAWWCNVREGTSNEVAPPDDFAGKTGDYRSGAGDVLTARFADAILSGHDIEEATQLAVNTSSRSAMTGEIVW